MVFKLGGNMKEPRQKNLPINPTPKFTVWKWVGPGVKDYEIKQYVAGQNLYLQEGKAEYEDSNK